MKIFECFRYEYFFFFINELLEQSSTREIRSSKKLLGMWNNDFLLECKTSRVYCILKVLSFKKTFYLKMIKNHVFWGCEHTKYIFFFKNCATKKRTHAQISGIGRGFIVYTD